METEVTQEEVTDAYAKAKASVPENLELSDVWAICIALVETVGELLAVVSQLNERVELLEEE